MWNLRKETNVDGTRGYYAERSKSIREGQTLYGLIIWGILKIVKENKGEKERN